MKHLFLIFALVASTVAVKSQDQKPTFEETVKYINEIVKDNRSFYFPGNSDNTSYLIGEVIVDKSGKILFLGSDKRPVGTFYLKDVNWLETYCGEDGGLSIKSYVQYKRWDGSLNFKTLGILTDIPIANCERLKKAIIYLQSLCTEKDPFAN